MGVDKEMAPASCSSRGPATGGMSSVTNSSLAHPTREQRGIALYRDHADEIRFEAGLWYVPSQHENTTVYEVVLGRRGESCECRDYEYRGGRCIHIYAATIAKAKTAPCSGCGERYRHRHLTEVGPDHLTLFEGDLVCPECSLEHGVS